MDDINKKTPHHLFFEEVLGCLCKKEFGQTWKITVSDLNFALPSLKEIDSYCLILDQLVIYTTYLPRDLTKRKELRLSYSNKLNYVYGIITKLREMYVHRNDSNYYYSIHGQKFIP